MVFLIFYRFTENQYNYKKFPGNDEFLRAIRTFEKNFDESKGVGINGLMLYLENWLIF
jgi:hypothetical protein